MRTRIGTETYLVDGTTINVTMTFGGASSAGKVSLTELLQAADRNLYRGKERGRNTSVFEGQGEPEGLSTQPSSTSA